MGLKTGDNRRQIREGIRHRFRASCLAVAIRGMDKGKTGEMSLRFITFGIADIDRSFDTMFFHERSYRHMLVRMGVAPAKIPVE